MRSQFYQMSIDQLKVKVSDEEADTEDGTLTYYSYYPRLKAAGVELVVNYYNLKYSEDSDGVFKRITVATSLAQLQENFLELVGGNLESERNIRVGYFAFSAYDTDGDDVASYTLFYEQEKDGFGQIERRLFISDARGIAALLKTYNESLQPIILSVNEQLAGRGLERLKVYLSGASNRIDAKYLEETIGVRLSMGMCHSQTISYLVTAIRLASIRKGATLVLDQASIDKKVYSPNNVRQLGAYGIESFPEDTYLFLEGADLMKTAQSANSLSQEGLSMRSPLFFKRRCAELGRYFERVQRRQTYHLGYTDETFVFEECLEELQCRHELMKYGAATMLNKAQKHYALCVYHELKVFEKMFNSAQRQLDRTSDTDVSNDLFKQMALLIAKTEARLNQLLEHNNQSKVTVAVLQAAFSVYRRQIIRLTDDSFLECHGMSLSKLNITDNTSKYGELIDLRNAAEMVKYRGKADQSMDTVLDFVDQANAYFTSGREVNPEPYLTAAVSAADYLEDECPDFILRKVTAPLVSTRVAGDDVYPSGGEPMDEGHDYDAICSADADVAAGGGGGGGGDGGGSGGADHHATMAWRKRF